MNASREGLEKAMEAAELASRTPSVPRRVLAVDDDDFARLTVRRHLEKRGFEVTVVESVQAAQAKIKECEKTPFDCVVTDYLMPGATGVDLILWLRQHEPTLATIMVTAIGEKDIVAETLRSGASNFLDKPVRAGELVEAVEAAIALTHRRRELAQAENDAIQVARIQKRMLGAQGPASGLRFQTAHYPMRGAGGDFSFVFPLGRDRSLVVLADVSGHDLRAAFISAYFQGIVRGMTESGQPIQDVLAYFNRVLIREWSSGGDFNESSTSLAVCAAQVDFSAGSVAVFNHGFPPAYLLDGTGRLLQPCPGGGPPLGWFEDAEPESATVVTPTYSSIVMWTDGLDDHAERMGVCAWTLASLLLRRGEGEERPEYLDDAPDDILVMRVPLSQAGLNPEEVYLWMAEKYRGAEYGDIDTLQVKWMRTLRLALPEWTLQRLDEVVLCLREAVLNALVHGAQRSEELTVALDVTFSPGNQCLQVVVTDPGDGHDFDWEAYHRSVEVNEMQELHRGLVFIHNLANGVVLERRGATVRMEFYSTPPQSADL